MEKEIMREVLQFYKNNPCLWNNKLKDYSNKYKRVQLIHRARDNFSLAL